MRRLTYSEIAKLASKEGVRVGDAEDFLGGMGNSRGRAIKNLRLQSALYRWDNRTVEVIQRGIKIAGGG